MTLSFYGVKALVIKKYNNGMKRTGYNVRFVQNFGKFRQYHLNNVGVNPPASYAWVGVLKQEKK